ncbi:MAG TPA: hypothetical protein VEJ84_05085 [Acidimicrobiales bacterium]|nr:hypothetical protein [Acidimicrobiales bacterium]
MTEMFGSAGQRFLDEVPFDRAYALWVESLRELIGLFDKEVTLFERELHRFLKDDKGFGAGIFVGSRDGSGRVRSFRTSVRTCRRSLYLPPSNFQAQLCCHPLLT